MDLSNNNGIGPLFNQVSTDNVLKFISLGSGSSGNSYILSTREDSIILDAGIGIRRVLRHFREMSIDTKKIRAIFITHDHADHTRGAIRLAYKLGVPIYTSHAVARSLLYHRYSSPDLSAYLRIMEVGCEVTIGDLAVTSFEVPHDATHNVGYSIETPHGHFVLSTDIGHITPDIIEAISKANYLIFESNYDDEMLKVGPYPHHLKQRICSGLGHLSNRIAAETIAAHYHKDLRFLALCHISMENNKPELALSTMRDALQSCGVNCDTDIRLHVLNRQEPEEFTLK